MDQDPTRAAPSGWIEVVVDRPLPPLTYRWPDDLDCPPKVGREVEVPLGRGRARGWIVALHAAPPDDVAVGRIKPIIDLPAAAPVPQPIWQTLCWAADYYGYPLGPYLAALLPKEDPPGKVRLLAGWQEHPAGKTLPIRTLLAGLTPHPFARFWMGWLQGHWGTVDREGRMLVLSAQGRAVTIAPRAHRQLALHNALLSHPLEEADAVAQFGRDAVRSLEAKGWVVGHKRGREGMLPMGPQLNPDQAAAVARLTEMLTAPERPALLFGTTGSGKTEVYLRIARTVVERGGQVLVVVPEIALTPQTAARFEDRFPGRVGVWHSAQGATDRGDLARRVRAGQVQVLVGTRSALFLPWLNLKLMVVDEEHDNALSQEEGMRYHGRDLAVVLAKNAGALCLLGTATPSVESWRNAEMGRYERIDLPGRAGAGRMPEVRLIDLRQGRDETDRHPFDRPLIAAPLRQALEEGLAKGEQAILLLNRRGYAPFLRCIGCGAEFACEHCAVPLTYHHHPRRLLCHYCGHTKPVPDLCPTCQQMLLTPIGVGIQQVEGWLNQILPKAKVLRLDRDTARLKGIGTILEAFRQGEGDILLGTQMLAKGHDFPKVTTVGVVLADQGLSLPDFRAQERLFQTLVQTSGRAGRAELPGQVFIQTFEPEHPLFGQIQRGEVAQFLDEELALRRMLGYPPDQPMLRVLARGKGKRVVGQALEGVARTLAKLPGLILLGPAPAPIERIQGIDRHHLLLRGPRPALRSALRLLQQWPEEQGVNLRWEVDPVQMM
ncbi:MAG: primosomal protein N' [Alphaproteobacteria bacterium CG_4_10_14_0_2_um_filter_63_37]|nr:MAG: primosomal protein N' [Proteobacteria bacterium CG1_02_64_396]PJA24888.1 MAG: primosomal protein N' [Alphaproteobacteria bacterium CG_4_10_14_0_2_um_filter_63_37]